MKGEEMIENEKNEEVKNSTSQPKNIRKSEKNEEKMPKKRENNVVEEEKRENYARYGADKDYSKSNVKRNNNAHPSNKKRKGLVVGLSVATAVLAVSTIGLGIGLGISENKSMNYQRELENVYRNNFYDLLDSVNNLENKMSKIINTTSSTYQRKTLLEASRNASEAEISVSYLPFSHSDIQQTIRMVNQIAGYTSTLAEKLVSGQALTEEEISTLEKIHQNVVELKAQLNEFERKLDDGYSILDSSANIDSDTNEFSRTLSNLKNNDVEYPTMIYDGPFSDSVVNSSVKGLKGNIVSKEDAGQRVEKNFKNTAIVDYEGETKGRFETYNFRITNADDEMLYIQVTQIGGHILTVSGAGRDGEQVIDMAKAKDIALEFVKENGVENGEVVWSDQIANDIYLNIAPKQSGIILYPDLVKVKVNLASGTIVGYDATSYFTNHVSRTLSQGLVSASTAIGKVPSYFEIVKSRTVLSPLDYNREVVCVEVEATREDGRYYFYFNAENGDLENVLKVIETDNGNLLM